jgi:hypothetical protein
VALINLPQSNAPQSYTCQRSLPFGLIKTNQFAYSIATLVRLYLVRHFVFRAFPSSIAKSLFVFFVHRVAIKLLHLRVGIHLDTTFSLCFFFFSLLK